MLASDALHGTAIDQMPLQVALLHERTVADVAVERPHSTMHADVCFDAEQLRVRSSTGQALEELIRSPGILVASEYFLVASVHAFTVFTG